MKIFVTGGTGFVGSHFVPQALQAGHELVALRRPGSRPRIACDGPVAWVDAALDSDLRAALRGCDAVVHLAAHTANPPYAPIDECLYWNVVAPTKLIAQAAEVGIGDVLVAGSCFEYGLAALDQAFVHPATELRPTQTYPVSKAAASVACLGLARTLGLRMRLRRIFQVFGAGESSRRFWPSLQAAALAGDDFPMSSGQQVRDFIPVEQVARELVASLDMAAVAPGRPEVSNLGTGQAQSLLDFAAHWWAHWGATGRLLPGAVAARPADVPRLVADVSVVHVA